MKLRLSLVLLGAAVVLSVASLAWACVPVSWFVRVSPSAGSPGSTVTVTAGGYESGETVSIYWGGAGGHQLAQGVGPSFSASVTIPADAAPGVHYIQAVGSSGRGGATDVFTIAPTTTGGGAPPNGAAAPDGVGQPARGGDVKSVSGEQGQGVGRTTLTAPSGEERSAASAPSTAAPGEAGGSTAAPVFEDSIPQELRRDEPLSGSTRPSERTSASDLWSGFTSSGQFGSSLSGDTATSPTWGLTPALALAGFGLLTLAAGLGAAEQRRRRAAASRAQPPTGA